MNKPARDFLTALLLTLPVVPTMAQADTGWFTHPFGELRSYNGDFLNVCSDGGAGACRTVNHVLEAGDSFYGTSRLALHRVDGGWAIELWDQDLPFDITQPFDLSVDGRAIAIDAADWSEISPDGVRVAQTQSILDPVVAAPLVDAIRRGFFLTVDHEAGQSVFSLRGLIAAQSAIEYHLGRMTK